MASTRRKSAAIALAVVGIAGLSLASAAQLTVTTTSLGAGSATVGACDADGIDVDYTVTGANVTGVTLTGVADACENDDFSVTLTDSLDAALTTLSGPNLTFVAAGTSDDQTVILAVTDTVPVASVTGVAIVISG